jgi:hypothetical protein
MGICGNGAAVMRTSYEVRCGQRLVSFQNANTASEAVIAYLRSMGCRDSELTSVAPNALTWGGAVYRAVPLGSDLTA